MDAWMFLVGVGVTTLCSLTVVRYLQPYLRDVLVGSRGTVQRASFWTAFSTVTLVLTPVVFAMHYRPPIQGLPVAFELGAQLELALAGLLSSVILLGFILSKFIPRGQPQ